MTWIAKTGKARIVTFLTRSCSYGRHTSLYILSSYRRYMAITVNGNTFSLTSTGQTRSYTFEAFLSILIISGFTTTTWVSISIINIPTTL